MTEINSTASDGDRGLKVRNVKEFKFKPGDILICSYPKSGCHWLLNMILKLRNLDISKTEFKETCLDYDPPEMFESMNTPRFISTHLKPSHLPTEHIENKGKIILMLRNPKDAMVSLYHHCEYVPMLKKNQTWTDFFQEYVSGFIPSGSYFDYVEQWEIFLKEKSTDQHVELFYYEDLKANLNCNIARLSFFLGFNRDHNYIAKVKEQTTLSALRQQDAFGIRETQEYNKDKDGRSVVYRKGEVGGWKNYLTVAQSELVDKMMDKSLKYRIMNIKYEL